MRVLQLGSESEAVDFVAQRLLEKFTESTHPSIGLATGKTMVPVYKRLVEIVKSKSINLSKCQFYLLDEYIGLPKNHPSSFRFYIDNHLRIPLGLDEAQFFLPNVHTNALEQMANRYEEQVIKDKLEIQLLGVGSNGHIGFNEPGSSKESKTRVVKLSDSTLQANKSSFVDHLLPTHAISMGVGTIMKSKELIMLATGKVKADIIKYLVNHHDDKKVPVTYLKSHPHFTLVLDPDAASKINLKI